MLLIVKEFENIEVFIFKQITKDIKKYGIITTLSIKSVQVYY